MTDKKLVQALRNCGTHPVRCKSCPYNGVYSGVKVCVDVLKNDAADRLEALLAENDHLREVTKMVPKWRPASEPPEEYRDEYGELKCFLVCVENVGKPFRAVYDGKHWGDGWNVVAVTHWMPLPSTKGVE